MTDKNNADERARTDRFNARMGQIEKELKRAGDQSANDSRMRKAQEIRVEEFLSQMGLVDSIKEKHAEKEKETEREQAWKLAAEKEKDKSVPVYKSSWAKNIENNLALEASKSGAKDQTKNNATTDKASAEVSDVAAPDLSDKVKEKVARKPIKMGNSIDTNELHDDVDWSWDESGEDWHGTVEREQDNLRKKKLRKEKLRKIQSATATKASLIVGAHPITQESIDKFNLITGDYEEAKIEAAKEYLINILGYHLAELQMVNITDTQVSSKGDNVLYIAVDDQDTIYDIRRREAERQHPDIFLRDFIPPQFFARFCALNRLCKELRENKTTKTQLRFTTTDFVILTKPRGSQEPYRRRELTREEKKDIPPFDHSLVWRKKTERPPRRRLPPIVGKVSVPSMHGKQSQEPAKVISTDSREKREQRLMSPGTKSPSITPSKKQKLNEKPSVTPVTSSEDDMDCSKSDKSL